MELLSFHNSTLVKNYTGLKAPVRLGSCGTIYSNGKSQTCVGRLSYPENYTNSELNFLGEFHTFRNYMEASSCEE